jgi:hypothetical protein
MNTVICNAPPERRQFGGCAVLSRVDEPGDLAKQRIIVMNNSGVGAWSFPPADGSTIPRTVQFTPRLLVNSVRAAVASAVEGRAVTRPLSYQVAEHARESRLQTVLRSDECPLAGPYRHAGGPAFCAESPRLRGLRRTSPVGAVRVPRCGRRRLTLNRLSATPKRRSRTG